MRGNGTKRVPTPPHQPTVKNDKIPLISANARHFAVSMQGIIEYANHILEPTFATCAWTSGSPVHLLKELEE